jgi:hypothetical protein
LTIIVNFFTLNCQFIDESSFDVITPSPLEGKQNAIRMGLGRLLDLSENKRRGFLVRGS